MIGSSTCLPKSMISPDRPRMQKLIATDQWTTWSSRVKRWMRRPVGPAVQLDRPEHEVEAEDRGHDQHHQPAAVERDRAVADLPPGLALGLDQHAGLAALDDWCSCPGRCARRATPGRCCPAGFLAFLLLLCVRRLRRAGLRGGLRSREARAGEGTTTRQSLERIDIRPPMLFLTAPLLHRCVCTRSGWLRGS